MYKEKNLGGRPKKGDGEKKERVVVYVRPCYVEKVKTFARALEEDAVIDMKVIDENKLTGVIQKTGRTAEDNIVETPEVINKTPQEPEKDYTLWQSDPLMQELDRAICYVTDGFGYPEAAEPVYKKHPLLWARLHNAKGLNKMDEYNVLMTELWEKVK